jgi:hypothetical protein
MPERLKSLLLCTICTLAGVLSFSSQVLASTDEPSGINLGDTSFNDGFGGLNPDFVYQQYFQIEHFSSINDQYGNKMPAYLDTSLTAVASVNQLIYISPLHAFGGALGMDTLVPFIELSSSVANNSPSQLKSNGFGIGDFTFGPFLQMPPVMMDGRPVFTQRFEFDVIAPVGKYNIHDDINQSSGFYSINPYWAFTVIPIPDLEFSSRLYYLYNFTNHNPAQSGPISAFPNSYQAGQAVSDNFAMSYTVMPHLDLGINGYIFQQLAQDKIDGVSQRDTETTDLSVGPGFTYTLNDTNIIFVNAYLPVIEKNTEDGFNLVLHYTHIF